MRKQFYILLFFPAYGKNALVPVWLKLNQNDCSAHCLPYWPMPVPVKCTHKSPFTTIFLLLKLNSNANLVIKTFALHVPYLSLSVVRFLTWPTMGWWGHFRPAVIKQKEATVVVAVMNLFVLAIQDLELPRENSILINLRACCLHHSLL